MDQGIKKNLLETVADLHGVPIGAYNLRADGETAERQTTANIDIVTKSDKPGIDIIIKPGTVNESVHIPVILAKSGLHDLVYNDFFVGEGADVTIVAGCGIHCMGQEPLQHDGIHTFHIAKNARVKYVEKHYGEGEGKGDRVMNPTTIVYIEEGGYMEMETTQISGITDTIRDTSGTLAEGATLIVKEKIMTDGTQRAETNFTVDLNGKGSQTDVMSRSVAKGESYQVFNSHIHGNAECYGHTECDAILMEGGRVNAIPSLEANSVDAQLIHEAAIGKIAGEQIIKLQTLGLTEEEAEQQIVNGFLR